MTLNRSKLIESMLEDIEYSMSQVDKSGLPLDSTQLRVMLDKVRRTLAGIKEIKSGKEVNLVVFDECHSIVTDPCGNINTKQ